MIACTFSCATIKTTPYFFLRENDVAHFTGVFVPKPDPNFKPDKNRSFVASPVESFDGSDTFIYKTEIIYKTVDIEGYKAFYAVETIDTIQKNPSIGPNHFLFAAMIFHNDTTFVAPVYRKEDLRKLKFLDFKYKIPAKVSSKDSVVIIDLKKTMILSHFKKTSITIDARTFPDCLTFTIRDIWPDAKYTGTVWLDPNYGVLKWIRSTGKIETRKL
jgi:hypothetical protein